MKNEEVKVSASRIIFNFMWEFKVIRKISEKIFYSPFTKKSTSFNRSLSILLFTSSLFTKNILVAFWQIKQ